MHKDESLFHTKVMKFLQHNKHLFTESYLFETKVIRRNKTSFPCSELSEKEERLLLQAKKRGVLQTHSDYGGMGTNCDGSRVQGAGYIFIQKFTLPENKIFYCIDIDDFINKRDSMTRKSMKIEDIHAIGRQYELYKIYERNIL